VAVSATADGVRRPPQLRLAQFRLAAEALAEVLRAARPADQILQALWRAHRECGARDRALVAELLYGVLRDYQRLRRVAGDDAIRLCALRVLDTALADAPTLARWDVPEVEALAAQLAALRPESLSAAERCNVPAPIWERWLAQYGEGETAALAQALNQPAPVDLRVNRLKADRDTARRRLAEDGGRAEPTPRSPLGLRLPQRLALQSLALYREGWAEPQDEGSQLLALLVAAKPGETVIDFCAGAGGKTLALAAEMQNHGRLLACDVSSARLERLGPRLQRAGVRCVQTLALADEHDAALQRWQRRADAVLVDAPCSATGIWRRNPELRLRLPDFAALAAQQRSILAAAAALVKPGGRLVYATCSLVAEENEAVAAWFGEQFADFEALDAGALLQAQGIDQEGTVLRLLPQREGTDGFFAAAFRRR